MSLCTIEREVTYFKYTMAQSKHSHSKMGGGMGPQQEKRLDLSPAEQATNLAAAYLASRACSATLWAPVDLVSLTPMALLESYGLSLGLILFSACSSPWETSHILDISNILCSQRYVGLTLSTSCNGFSVRHLALLHIAWPINFFSWSFSNAQIIQDIDRI